MRFNRFTALVVFAVSLFTAPFSIDACQKTEADTSQTESAAKKNQDSNAKPAAVKKQDPVDLETLRKKEEEEFAKQTIKIPATWKRMSKDNHIWVDKKNKQVIVRGAICLREGLLEMFACPRNTKEHESIVSVHARAYEAHATLLALGIRPGKPMLWVDDYRPVSGPIINVEVWWMEGEKLVKRRAQDMILNTDTEKPMKADFVFGGSELYKDPNAKEHSYMADFGPFINVANQPDAMIDVSIRSSEAAQGSLFAANPKIVPPVNTKVYIVLSDSGKKANVDAPTKPRSNNKTDGDSGDKKSDE